MNNYKLSLDILSDWLFVLNIDSWIIFMSLAIFFFSTTIFDPVTESRLPFFHPVAFLSPFPPSLLSCLASDWGQEFSRGETFRAGGPEPLTKIKKILK